MFGLFKDIEDKFGEHFIEKFFLSMIEGFAVKDLEQAVKDDISLLDQAQICNPRSLSFAEKVAKQFNGYKDFLTTENVMIWIKPKRSDMYWHLIGNIKSKMWLERQVREFKSFLFEY